MTLSVANFSVGAGTIYDIAAAAIFLFVVVRYARKGFLAGIIQFVGNLVSVFGAQWVSRNGAPIVFENVFEGVFTEHLNATMLENGLDISALIEKYAGFLPQSVRQSIVESAETAVSSGSADMVDKVVSEVIAPLVTPIIAVLIFFLAYALVRAVVALLVQLLVNVNRLPVLGGVNGLLGAVLGVAAGLLDLFLLLCAVWAVLIITGNNLAFLNEDILAGSIVYNCFSGLNPFV